MVEDITDVLALVLEDITAVVALVVEAATLVEDITKV
jgi:hypothetical protein